MAGNRNATPAQPTTGSAITDDKSRGGLFTNSNNTDINANAAQAVAVDTAEAEAAARAAAASAAGAATAAATATAAAGRAEMEADQAAQSAASARISEQRAEDWVEGPSHGGYTYRRAVRDDAGNLLGTWAGQDTPRTVEEYLMADAMTRGNFMIDIETIEINATDDPTDTNNSQYWVGQAANGALEAAEAEVELLDAIARAASINVDIDFLQAMIAYTRFLDIGDRLLTTEQRGILDTNNVLPLSATISTEQFTAAGTFPTAGVIYSARAWSNLAQREANRAESEADAASNSANSAATAANNALAAENAAEAAANTATAASTAAGVARDAAIEARDRAIMAETNAEASENAALGSAELAMEWAQGTVTARADGSLGVDDSLLQAEPGVPNDAHSSAYWADTSHLWSGAEVDRTGNMINDVNDASLQTIYPGAQSAAYWAWQAQRASELGILPWDGFAHYDAGHLVSYQETGGSNRIYESLVEIDAVPSGGTPNPNPTTPAGMMQWRDIAMHAVAPDEITVETGSVSNTNTTDINFNADRFNQMNSAGIARIDLNLDNITATWARPVQPGGDAGQVPRARLEGAITYWADTTVRTYNENDIVFYSSGDAPEDSNLWIATQDSPDNTPPSTTNSQWRIINLSQIATNAGAISSLDGEIGTLQTDVNVNTDNIRDVAADVLGIESQIETLQQEFVNVIEGQAATTVFHNSIARVTGNGFEQLYWRFGADVSGVQFSDFVGTNNSPRDNITGYVRLTGGSGGGTTVHYQNSQGNTLDLVEVEYDPRTDDRSAQILFTGAPDTGSNLVDTVQLMEVYTEAFDVDNTPHLSAVRIGDTVYQVAGGGATHTPTLTLRANHPVVYLYQSPEDFVVTYTGTIENGTLPDMDFANQVSITNVSPVANSLTRVNGTTFTFQVSFPTQSGPPTRAAHTANVVVRNVEETDTGTHMDLPGSVTIHTDDGRSRNAPSATPTVRMLSSLNRVPEANDPNRAIAIQTHASTANVNAGIAYDIESFTATADSNSPIMITNADGSFDYQLVDAQIPARGSTRDIQIVYNFPTTPANSQPTVNLSSTIRVERFDPWILVLGDSSGTDPTFLNDTYQVSTERISNDASNTIAINMDATGDSMNPAANVFVLTTSTLTSIQVNGGTRSEQPIMRGTTMVGDANIEYNVYQVFNVNQPVEDMPETVTINVFTG